VKASIEIPDATKTLLEVIRTRRSIKQINYDPSPIPPEYLELMLEAANYAPTHALTEPWRFSVFTGDSRQILGETFAESYRLGTLPEAFKQENQDAQLNRVWLAPVWISLGMVVDSNPKIPEWEEVAAVACAVQNMQLVARSLGLGSFWASGMPVRHENTARLVGLEPPHKLVGFLLVGRPKEGVEWPKAIRKNWREKVSWRE
jgi:nitroreductase